MNNDLPLPAASGDENLLLSEHYEALREAVEILYVRDNLSGRLNFAKEWPDVAAMLFGEELTQYDQEGAEDRERWIVLQEEADDRWAEFLLVVESFAAKSVEQSVLQIEFVEGLIKRFGREVSLLLYAPKIVDRFLPPPVAPSPLNDDVAVESVEAVPVPKPPSSPLHAAPVSEPVVPARELPQEPVEQPPQEIYREVHRIKPAAAADKPYVPPVIERVPSVPPEDVTGPPKLEPDAMDLIQPISIDAPEGAKPVQPEPMIFMPSKKADENPD